jgi:Mn-dependent DtxR family transcriptional regulator
MLISPAATALLLSHRMKTVLVLSGLLGVLSAVAGLWLAIIWETTPGPAMAVTATSIYLLAAIFAPGKGLLYKYLAKRSLHRKVASEDMLKAAYHSQQAEGAFDEQQWRHAANLSASEWSRQKNRLGRKGWLNASGSGLSEKGAAEAERLVRAHRLWETYLARQVGVDIAHIHTDAEHYEHLLTEVSDTPPRLPTDPPSRLRGAGSPCYSLP